MLNVGLGSISGFAERTSLFRSLTTSLSSSSSIGENSSFFRSLSASWGTSARYARGTGFAETFRITLGSREFLSGHSGCVNCESVTGYFAFLVIAFGVLVFGVYAAKQRRQPGRPPTEPEEERVVVDAEGWETKASETEEEGATDFEGTEEAWQANPSQTEEPAEEGDPGDDEGWESKSES